MKCIVCKNGDTVPGTTTVVLEHDGAVLIFQEVPAKVCDTCGEGYTSMDVTDQILLEAETAMQRGVRYEVIKWQHVPA